MNTKARYELEKLFFAAEQEHRCLTAADRRLTRNLQRAAKLGLAVRPLQGVYALRAWWDTQNPRERAASVVRGLALMHPSWVFAGPSAAVLQGLSTSSLDLTHIYVSDSSASSSRSTDDIVRIFVEHDEPALVDGVCVTSLIRTAFDCMRMQGFRRALAVADSALRVSGLSRNQLLSLLNDRFTGYRRIGFVRSVAGFADGLSQNGGESMARAAIIELGYQIPELQAKVTDPIDGTTYFADYLWRLGGHDMVAGELDGREKYTNPQMTDGRSMVDVLADERLRESRISARSIRVMRFSYRESQDDARFSSILDAFGIPKRAE